MTERAERTASDEGTTGAGPSDASVDTSGAGVDPTIRPEVAGDPEVAAMIRALEKDDDDPSDIRADVSEASEHIGTGTDR